MQEEQLKRGEMEEEPGDGGPGKIEMSDRPQGRGLEMKGPE